MFWGLILKANKKYTQTLEKPFHLTKASLDHSNADNEPIQVMYSDGQSTFLMCTLQKGKELQCSLDLNFDQGDTVCFSTKGNGIVHLTGYLIPDYDDAFGDMSDDDEEEGAEDEEIEDLRDVLKKKKKEKEKTGKEKTGKDKKKAPVEEEDSDEDEEESDEEAQNGNGTLDSSALADSDDDDDDDDEDDDEDDDDDDEEDDDEEDESEEEEAAPPKSKQVKLDPQQQKKQQKNGLENGQDKKKDKKDNKQQQQQKEQKKENKQQPAADNKVQKLQGGLLVQDLKVGGGAEARPGKKIQVYYEGRLKSNNKVFDATKNGPGFKMTLGRGEVIKGWDIGLAGMKVGGKRRLTCPPNLAYGPKGNPPVIPANSTLVFDVELKNVL